MDVLQAVRGPLMIAAGLGMLSGVVILPWLYYQRKRRRPTRAAAIVLPVMILPMLASFTLELAYNAIARGRVLTPGRHSHGYYALASDAGQISLALHVAMIVVGVAAIAWFTWRLWRNGATPAEYAQQPGIGGLLPRLRMIGVSLNPVQDWALELLLSALPVHIKGVVDRQFGSFDDVRLEADGSLLIFVRRSRDPSHSPRLPMTATEAPLARLTATVLGDSEPLQATLTAVHGQVFSLRFNRATARLPLSQLRLTGVVSAYPPMMPEPGRASPPQDPLGN